MTLKRTTIPNIDYHDGSPYQQARRQWAPVLAPWSKHSRALHTKVPQRKRQIRTHVAFHTALDAALNTAHLCSLMLDI